ncbi:MAG: S41 family peptidase [Planctomycetota bacterium]|nr:MAG: S41 family peptidase [Planctomycetota bacterium]REJ91200.1 MAG: S41 family peptidase [Planctomycetota bacterium]
MGSAFQALAIPEELSRGRTVMRRYLSIGGLLSLGLIAGMTVTIADERDREERIPQGKSNVGAERNVAGDRTEEYYELFEVLADTVDQIERNYVEPIDRRELMEAAIKGMLSKLDAHSGYVPPEEVERFNTSVNSEFGGIGITVTVREGQLTVVSPLVGTPAYRAGVRAGDRIVEIDGESTRGLLLNDAVKLLKGRNGTQVRLGVVHEGEVERQEYRITRGVIQLDTVYGRRRKADDSWDFMLDEDQGIGYIQINTFTARTTDEIRTALSKLRKRDFQGLVLDLRFNPGGLLTSAIEVCDMFIEKGEAIVSTKGRNVETEVWKASGKGRFRDVPIAVLINRYSASASEIVSACLQDHQRAVVVGERSWGKGSVQNVINLEGGNSVLMLTTASYHRPSGKNIHRFPDAEESDEWGVQPDDDFEVKLTAEETFRLILARRGRDVVGDADDVAVGDDEFIDRQLRRAVEYLTQKIAAPDAA